MKNCLFLVIVFSLVGCVEPYHGSYSPPYTATRTSYTPAMRCSPVVTVVENPVLTPVHPSGGYAISAEPGEDYRRQLAEYNRLRKERADKDREMQRLQNLDDAVWKENVKNTYAHYKITMKVDDAALEELRRAIVAAGRNPIDDPRYVALLERRNMHREEAARFGVEIDDMIIDEKSRRAAGLMQWSEQERGNADAAIKNLRRAREQ